MGKTVLVLGAGASAEVNLPVGEALKRKIASLLAIQVEDGEIRNGDSCIIDGIRLLAREAGTRDINPWLRAARQIVAAMPLAISIDNYLHQHKGNAFIESCGKLAIVRAILQAERSSLLSIDIQRHEVDVARTQDTWFNGFFKLLTEGCTVDDLSPRLANLAVVCFNYDRCLEHFIFHALKRVYHIGDDRAADLAAIVEIYHPYGQVGRLPWQGPAGYPWTPGGRPTEFGSDVHPNVLIQLAKEVKTFTEGTDPESSEIVAVRELVIDATRLIYLGFGYIDQNLKLLYDEKAERTASGPCYGTASGISTSNCADIRNQVGVLGKYGDVRLFDEQCREFVYNQSRKFAFTA